MKKFILVALAALFVCSAVDAQILRADELEKYAKEKYGEKWVDAATNLGTQLTLDKNNAITYTQVIPAEGKTKDQLYVLLNYWVTATFNDANSVIKLNDKELGTIIAQGFVESIAQHAGGTNSYKVNLRPVIKCDIKDNKVRVTYTVPSILSMLPLVAVGWVQWEALSLPVQIRIGHWINVIHLPRRTLTRKLPAKHLSWHMPTLM